MRAWLLPFAMLALSGSALRPPHGIGTIASEPVALDRFDPRRVRVGGLRFLGGWRLTSRDLRFGGISTLQPWRGGLLAVSDQGYVYRLRERGGAIAGAVLGRVAEGPPRAPKRYDRDIEASASDPASGLLWLGYEAWMAIWRYDPALAHSDGHATPRLMRDWPRNGAIEALVRLPDGGFVAFCEECDAHGGPTEAIRFAADPAVPGARGRRLLYRSPAGYAVTDAALMPDGRQVMLLLRRLRPYEGWSAIVALVPVAAFDRAIVPAGRIVARIGVPLTMDNMEGLAVTREGARTIVWIASDDNFSTLQRSLLLKFALK